ncbi:MAG: 4Fe-4S dicluster domain-containing protein [bacterium]
MRPGKEQRLNRILDPRSGRAMVVAADHGWMSDVTDNVIRLRSIVKEVVAGGANAILVSFGTAMRLCDLLKGHDAPAMLIRADWMNYPRLGSANVQNVVPAQKLRRVPISRARDALELGASGITIYYFIGYSDEVEKHNLESCAQLACECSRIGLPLIIEPLAIGGMITGANYAEVLTAGARIAVEVGADALKIPYTGDIITFRKLCKEADVPVLVLGGARSHSPRDALEVVDEAVRAGAAGVVFGRNVTKSKDPRRMVQDICALLHGGKSVDEIMCDIPVGRIRLKAHTEFCTGCRICQIACHQKHTGAEGISEARIQVVNRLLVGVLPIDQAMAEVRVCDLCGKCVTECPVSALSVDGGIGMLKLDEDLCNLCGVCVEVCPQNVMLINNGHLLFCDLCGGKPECVRWCHTGALEIVSQS